jgi:hypothetical protein
VSFSIFIVGKSLVNNHLGEEYDFVHEIPDNVCFDSLPEHSFLLRGVIRSAWYDFSHDIDVICDCNPEWYMMIEDLLVVMKEEEAIEFNFKKGTEQNV